MPDGIVSEFQVVLLAACRTSSEDLNFFGMVQCVGTYLRK